MEENDKNHTLFSKITQQNFLETGIRENKVVMHNNIEIQNKNG